MISASPTGRGGFFDPLVRNGPFYYRLDGSPITLIEATGFAAFEKHLRRDESLDLFLEQMRDEGVNLLRVFMMNTSVHHLLPWEWPNYYEEILPFVARCGSYGIHPELVVFTQPGTLMPRLEDQQAHYDRVVDALGDKFAFVEVRNEYNAHPDSDTHPGLRIWKPAGATFDLSAGSQAAGDEVPISPMFDSIRYHTNDLSEWQRKQAHNGMEMSDHNGSRPCIANENTRTDKDGNAYRHYDAARGATGLCAGSCIHTPQGKLANVVEGNDLVCLREFVRGAKSFDLSQRTQPYFRIEDPAIKRPEDLRCYQKGTQIMHVRA